MSFHCVSALFPRALLLQSLAGTTAPPPGSRELRRCGSVRFGSVGQTGRSRSALDVKEAGHGARSLFVPAHADLVAGASTPVRLGRARFGTAKSWRWGGEWGAIMKKIAHCDQKSLKTSFTSGMRCNEGALRSEDPSWLLL